MKRLLWLDDYRNPYKGNWVDMFSPIKNGLDIYWVKSYDEFTRWILLNGLPDIICFDHDLGYDIDPNVTDVLYHNDEISVFFLQPYNDDEKTGYDAAKWLCDYCFDNNLKLPLYGIQSSNEVGKENIDCLLQNYIKYVENE